MACSPGLLDVIHFRLSTATLKVSRRHAGWHCKLHYFRRARYTVPKTQPYYETESQWWQGISTVLVLNTGVETKSIPGTNLSHQQWTVQKGNPYTHVTVPVRHSGDVRQNGYPWYTCMHVSAIFTKRARHATRT